MGIGGGSFRALVLSKSIFPRIAPENRRKSRKIIENPRIFHYFCNFKRRSDRATANRDMQIFLEVFRSIPDTLLKFGGDWWGSFRALVSTKLKNFQKVDLGDPGGG